MRGGGIRGNRGTLTRPIVLNNGTSVTSWYPPPSARFTARCFWSCKPLTRGASSHANTWHSGNRRDYSYADARQPSLVSQRKWAWLLSYGKVLSTTLGNYSSAHPIPVSSEILGLKIGKGKKGGREQMQFALLRSDRRSTEANPFVIDIPDRTVIWLATRSLVLHS